MNLSNPATTIDEYIALFPEPVQVLLRQVRKLVATKLPTATEAMRYGLPTFQIDSKNVIHFGAFKHHLGFYPGPAALTAMQSELQQYVSSKGAVQFPLDQPLPLELITSLVELAAQDRVKTGAK